MKRALNLLLGLAVLGPVLLSTACSSKVYCQAADWRTIPDRERRDDYLCRRCRPDAALSKKQACFSQVSTSLWTLSANSASARSVRRFFPVSPAREDGPRDRSSTVQERFRRPVCRDRTIEPPSFRKPQYPQHWSRRSYSLLPTASR